MSGGWKTNLCGLLRHQAPHDDSVSKRLRLSRFRAGTSAGGDRSASAAGRRTPRPVPPRSQHAPVAALFHDRFVRRAPQIPRAAAAHRRRRGRSGRRRLPPRSRPRPAASFTIIGQRRSRLTVWRRGSRRCSRKRPGTADRGSTATLPWFYVASKTRRARSGSTNQQNRSAFQHLLARLIRTPEEPAAKSSAGPEPSRLIVP